mgnify:CR=1 FL=1
MNFRLNLPRHESPEAKFVAKVIHKDHVVELWSVETAERCLTCSFLNDMTCTTPPSYYLRGGNR